MDGNSGGDLLCRKLTACRALRLCRLDPWWASDSFQDMVFLQPLSLAGTVLILPVVP